MTSRGIWTVVAFIVYSASGGAQPSGGSWPIGIYAHTDDKPIKLQYYTEAYVGVRPVAGAQTALEFRLSPKATIPRANGVRSVRVNMPGWKPNGRLVFAACREGKERSKTEFLEMITLVSQHGLASFELTSPQLSESELGQLYDRMQKQFHGGDGVTVEGFVGLVIQSPMGDRPRLYPVQVFPPEQPAPQ
jgi:hypothetical protein